MWRSSGKLAPGLEAIEAAAELTPDVILMDISLPDITGIEAARADKRAVSGHRHRCAYDS